MHVDSDLRRTKEERVQGKDEKRNDGVAENAGNQCQRYIGRLVFVQHANEYKTRGMTAKWKALTSGNIQ